MTAVESDRTAIRVDRGDVGSGGRVTTPRRDQGRARCGREGVFIGDSYNDSPSSDQRAAELRLRVGELEAEAEAVRSQMVLLSGQIAEEDSRYHQRADALVVLPPSGRVWEMLTGPGEHVSKGQDLMRVLNCAHPIVSANVDEGVYNRLEVGAPAEFRPSQGGGKIYAARIVNLTGAAAASANLAIPPVAMRKSSLLCDRRRRRHERRRLLGRQDGNGDLRGARRSRGQRKDGDPGTACRGRRQTAGSSGPRSSDQPIACPPSPTIPLSSALTPALITFGLFIIAAAVWPKPTAASRPLMIAISIALMTNYAWWRVSETLPPPALTGEYAIALLFLFTESSGMVAAALSNFFLMRTRRPVGRRRRQRGMARTGGALSFGRRAHLHLQRGAVDPGAHDRRRARDRLPEFPRLDARRRPPRLAEGSLRRLGCRYVSRPDNKHAKAGNINNALEASSRRCRIQPEFVSILDADFVATPRFLKRAMTLFRDPAVGVVQTPQHFVNPDPIQINLGATAFWPDEQRYFFDVVMPSKDAWGGAFCCGTSSVIRLAPLMAIGGFPTDSVTEDYLLTCG